MLFIVRFLLIFAHGLLFCVILVCLLWITPNYFLSLFVYCVSLRIISYRCLSIVSRFELSLIIVCLLLIASELFLPVACASLTQKQPPPHLTPLNNPTQGDTKSNQPSKWDSVSEQPRWKIKTRMGLPRWTNLSNLFFNGKLRERWKKVLLMNAVY